MAKELNQACVLAINGGSSNIKFALHEVGDALEQRLYGKVDRIGLSGTNLTFHNPDGKPQASRSLAAADHRSAASLLIDWLEVQPAFAAVQAVGHRVVHSMTHSEPEQVTPELMDELHRITPYDPDHLPREIELIEAFRQRHPKLPQVACFDTAFHHTMPRVAKLLPIPRRFDTEGVQRYGFHGLSYAYRMEELARLGDPAATTGRVILAHLGNGASLAAVRDGKSIDTSMGFTPTAGLVMSTRSGDLDPGLAPYLARTEQITTQQFYEMVNHESGLLGVSETSSDMRDLLAREAGDVRAAEAVALFCYQAKKWIGSFAAALGGLDTLVFAGGIGENAPLIRARICEGLGFLGIALHESRNAETIGVISTDASRATVRVIRTDEEQLIARSMCRVLGLGRASEQENSDHGTKYTSRLDPPAAGGVPPWFTVGWIPHSEAPSAGVILCVLAPVQIAVKPISQSRCPPGVNREPKRHARKERTTMLSKANTLKGYKLGSRDGEIGKVKEFYFDDHHWTIRYLVADTGNWLTGRQVLISPYALVAVNPEQQHIVIDLTKKQIEDSPPLSSDRPVSRRFEEAYYGYYGWPMYWDGPNMWGVYPYLVRDPEEWDQATQGEKAWDPHLRSTHDVSGHHIQAADGEIGHVEDFIIDDETWAIRYLIVDTRNWWPGRKVLVAPQWIERVSWRERKVFVNLPRESIRQSPEYAEESLPTRDYEIGLHGHYNRQGYWVDEPAAQEHSR